MADLPFKTKRSNPGLEDLLDALKRDIMLSLNCHAVATVQNFNADAQTVDVTINYGITTVEIQDDGSYLQSTTDYPPITDVPVMVLCGGSAGISFPIVQGDQCLLLFNDRDIDNWAAGFNSGPVASPRLHSTSDAFALVGLNDVSNYSTSHAQLFNGQTVVGVSSSKVLLNNSVGKSLGTTLSNLCTALTNLTSALSTAFATNAVNGSPLDPGWSSAVGTINTALNQAKTDLAGLLE